MSSFRASTPNRRQIREGRRASDGLVAQGLVATKAEHPGATVAFDSQRLTETCKAKGVLELHLLQKEAAQLSEQFQANITPDELTARQLQHNQFHYSPKAQGKQHRADHTNLNRNYEDYINKAGDLAIFASKIDAIKEINRMNELQSSPLQKPPLQQQLMQHRLLQQKRQILQKQMALENCLSRRQMLRQQSYKIAQQQQVLPALGDYLSDDLIAYQRLLDSSMQHTKASACLSSPKLMKTTHIQQQSQQQPAPMSPLQQHHHHPAQPSPNLLYSPCFNDCWSLLATGAGAPLCTDSELISDDEWSSQQQLYQV